MGLFKKLFCFHCYKQASPLEYGSYSSVIMVCKYCGKKALAGYIEPWATWE